MNFLDKFGTKLIRRLAVPSLLMSVLAVCVISSLTYMVARATLQEKAIARLRLATDLHEEEMTRWVEDQKKSVVFISRASIVRESIADLLSYESEHPYYTEAIRILSEYLFAYIKTFDGLREIMVLSNRGGEVLFSTLRESEGEYRSRDTFFVRGQDTLSVQGVYPWRGTSEPTITISKPLLDANGEKKGVLAVHLDLERLDEIVRKHPGDSDTEEVYLVDKYNSFVSVDRFGSQDFPRGVHSEGIERAVRGEEGFGFYTNHVGVPVVGYYRWNPELEVALLAEVSQSEAFAPARRLGFVIAGTGGFLTLCLIIATILASLRIARPILKMSEIASDIAAGDFTLRVPELSRDETGDLVRSFNSMVTKFNVVHGELQRSAEHFRSVFRLSPDSIGVQRADSGIFVNVNDSFCEVFGYTQEDVIGLSAAELQIWQTQRDRLRLVAQLRQKRQVVNFTARFRKKNGELFSGIISSRLIELEDETHIVSVLLDISTLQQAEESLRYSNERLQLLINRMPIGCITWNTDFTVSLWNPEAEKIFGYSEADAIGKHAFELIVPLELQPLVAPVWQQLMAGDETAHNENENVTNDGRTIFCDWYNTPIKDEQGEAIGVISMVRDITDKKQAEDEVRLKSELLQTIMNAIPAPIFFKDTAGVYQECNTAFTEFLGIEYEQIVGHTAYDIAPAEKARVYEEADRKLLKQGGMQTYEAKVRFADGSDRDVIFHKAVFTDPGATVAGLVGVMLDVSDIRTVEDALRESEQRYREIFNASSDAIVLRDAQSGHIVDVNRSMLEMYGFTYAEALQTSFSDLADGTPPYTEKQAIDYLRKAIAGEPQLFEWRAKRKDGTRFWAEIALKQSSIRGKDRTLAVVRNIEERKATEKARMDSEERFQMLIEHAADSLFLHDGNGCILNVNQRACDSLGYDRLELIGMTVDQFEQGTGIDVLKEIWAQMEEGKSFPLVAELAKKNGGTFPVEVNIVKFESHGSSFFLAQARDITQRKATEVELELYREQLEELVRERTKQLEEAQHELVAKERLAVLGQLTATVSHELRNPLGTVKNAIYLLGKLKDDGAKEKALDLADRNVKRCDGIINELLDFTRSNEGTPEKVDMGKWLHEILDEQILPDDIELRKDFAPKAFVSVDPERLRRAFINIFTNGMQALAGRDVGQKRLSVDLVASDQRVQIIITDNGHGISDEVMARIFEPMFSTKNFGVGLGMPIVKNIMEEHSGGVELDSHPGEGTSVSLWLPRRQEPSVED